jgi:hypothetical protein
MSHGFANFLTISQPMTHRVSTSRATMLGTKPHRLASHLQVIGPGSIPIATCSPTYILDYSVYIYNIGDSRGVFGVCT